MPTTINEIVGAVCFPSHVFCERRVVLAVVDTPLIYYECSEFVPSPSSHDFNKDNIHYSHADHMLSIILAVLNIGWGGVDPGMLSVIPISICQETGCTWSELEQGLKTCLEVGPDIILMSLGGRPTVRSSGQVSSVWIEELVKRGCLPVAAIENSSTYGHSFPACCRGVLPVAAGTMDGKRLATSGYCVDVYQRGTIAPGIVDSPIHSGEEISGTSVAAAIVAAMGCMLVGTRDVSSTNIAGYAICKSSHRSGRTGLPNLQTALTIMREDSVAKNI